MRALTAPRTGQMPAFPQPYPPQAFEKAMVFIDETNFLGRMHDARLAVRSLWEIAQNVCSGFQLMRAYVCTIESRADKAKKRHGDKVFDRCRLVFGPEVATGNGKTREKGVDALLVADLIYHAASNTANMQRFFLTMPISNLRLRGSKTSAARQQSLHQF